MNTSELIQHIDKLHTTELGIVRIKRNLALEGNDVVTWCKNIIRKQDAKIIRKGKNWYVTYKNIIITVNAHSYTVITAHKIQKVL